MRNPLANLLLVLTFFTRLRIPKRLGKRIGHDASLSDAVLFFPVVGLGIGLVTGSIWYLASSVLPAMVAAGLVLVVGFLLTGGLHEDGLADCADGLGGSSDREKSLEIMRDSTIGTYGGLALIISVGLRWACIATLTPLSGMLALIVSHTVSRSVIPIAMKFSQYARPAGLGKLASGETPEADFYASVIFAFVCSGLCAGLEGLIASTFALFFGWCFLKYLEARLDGYTGDGLGAMQQIAEITTLVLLVGAWT